MKKLNRLLVFGVVLAMLAAACADDAEETTTTAAPAATTTTAAAPAATTTTAAAATTTTAAVLSLAEVCPDPVVIQTNWFPQAEHGPSYQLVGDDYTVDTESLIVKGSLMAQDVDTGVDIEIRTGGPAVGYQSPSALMYSEGGIHFAYDSTATQILRSVDTPTIAVFALLDKSPLGIMWDPVTYPDVTSIEDLGTAGITVLTQPATYVEVLISEGLLSEDQVDRTYDSTPSRWIIEDGAIGQQVFVSEGPYSYEFVFEDWGKPVAYQILHEAGYPEYLPSLTIRADSLETLRPCLEQLVPIMQQATVDFVEDPSRATGIILDTVAQYDTFWRYGADVAAFSYATMLDQGLLSDGPDGIVGNYDEERVNLMIAKLTDAGMDVDAGVTFALITTNEFIDPSIGLGR
jgi:hypothetical protein